MEGNTESRQERELPSPEVAPHTCPAALATFLYVLQLLFFESKAGIRRDEVWCCVPGRSSVACRQPGPVALEGKCGAFLLALVSRGSRDEVLQTGGLR